MSFKTILLHLNDEDRIEQLAGAARFLARATNAHVIALYVRPATYPPVEVFDPAAYSVFEEQMRRHLDQAGRVKSKAEHLLQGETFTWEWRFVEMQNFASLCEGVAHQARVADVVIASQGPVELDWLALAEVPEVVALKSGRPVIVIPRSGTFDSFGETITVAWDGRREAARAVFDALPLLQKAKRVRVVTVSESDEKRRSNEVPGADIAVALDRHGVRVETAVCTDGASGAGRALLADASTNKSDLVVMGAYGHSRLREFVLGGATRHVLQNATVPVLMSH